MQSNLLDVKYAFLNGDLKEVVYVAKGYAQRCGVDYDDTFAPMAQMATIRATLTVARKKRWLVYWMDVKSTFLDGDLKEVYVESSKMILLLLLLGWRLTTLFVASKKRWSIYQMDVKSSFLNGVLKVEVYVEQPLGPQLSAS